MRPVWFVTAKKNDGTEIGRWSSPSRRDLAEYLSKQDFGPAGSWTLEVQDMSEMQISEAKRERQRSKRKFCLNIIDSIGAYNDDHPEQLASIDGAAEQTGQIILALLAGRLEKSRDAIQMLGVSLGYPYGMVQEIVSLTNEFLQDLGPAPTIERDPEDEAVELKAPAAPVEPQVEQPARAEGEAQ